MASTGSNSSAQDVDAAVTHADIVVALTSFNDVETIGSVVQALQDGLAQSFASSTVQFVLADAGSMDRTRDVVREMVGRSALVEVDYERGGNFDELPYHGYPGRAAALRAILQTAQRVNAKGCAVIDANLQPVEPNWIEQLIAPVLSDGFDYVSPYTSGTSTRADQTRHRVSDIQALFRVRLRQPVASDLALATYGRTPDGAGFLGSGRRVSGDRPLAGCRRGICGVRTAKRSSVLAGQRPGDAGGSRYEPRAGAGRAVYGPGAARRYLAARQEVDLGSVFGSLPADEASAPSLNVDELVRSFRLGYRELRKIWTWVLPPRTLVELRKLSATASDGFRFDDRLWASIVYDCTRRQPPGHAPRSLAALADAALLGMVGVIRFPDEEHNTDGDRGARRASVYGFRIGETLPDLAVAMARAPSLSRLADGTKRSSHVGTS